MLFLTPNQQCHSRYSYSLTTFAILVASWFMDLLMHCMALYFRAKCPQRILRTTTFHCFCSSVCRLFFTLKTAAIFLWVYRGFREKLDHQSVVVFPEEKSQLHETPAFLFLSLWRHSNIMPHSPASHT